MNREKKMVKNTLIIGIGKILTQLINFLLLPVYTGFLTTAEYGTVDLLNTLVTLCVPIITFQIEQAVFRFLIEERKADENKSKIITNALSFVTIQILFYSIIFVIFSFFINNEYKMFLMINLISYIYLSILQQVARGIGDNKKYAFGSFLSALFVIFFNVIFLVGLRMGAYGMLLATFLGQCISILYFIVSLKLFKYIKIKTIDIIEVKKLLKYSLPLVPNQLSWWIFNVSDRVIVSIILGVSSTGILAAASKFSAIVTILYNIFDMSWIESVSLNIKDSDIENYFNKMYNLILNFFISIGLGIIAFMPFFYDILINRNYRLGYNLVPLTIIATVFNVASGLVSVVFAAEKNTKDIAKTSMVAAILNIIIHLSLIKFIGLYAAVISTVVSFVALAMYRTIKVNNNYFKVIPNKRIIIISILLAISLCYIYYSNSILLYYFGCIIAVLYAIILNKNNVKTLLLMLKRKKMKGELS